MSDGLTVSSSRTVILRALLEAPDTFVSGAYLADKLGVSRVSVWKVFEQLRSEGFEFEAVRRRGYRIVKYPVRAHPDWIRVLLEKSSGRAVSLSVHEVLDSTSSEAERWLADGKQTPHVIIANRQTRGRGRQGRYWISDKECNLYLSALFQPDMIPSDLQKWTLWVGVHIARALQPFTSRSIQIKWPNDLWINGCKLGGMLTEARIDYDKVRDLVFGFGLNINAAPSGAEVGTSCLNGAGDGSRLAVSVVAAAAIEAVLTAYESVSSPHTSSQLTALWPAYDALSGQALRVERGGQLLEGVCYGIDSSGFLLVEDSGGRVHRIHSGEVERVRSAPQPG